MKLFKCIIKKTFALGIVCTLFMASFKPNIANAETIDVSSNEEITDDSTDGVHEDSGLTLISVVRTPKSGISTYDIDRPYDSELWDLSDENLYHYYVSSQGNSIYSKYVFTGHNGRVQLMGIENGGKTGSYNICFYISDALWDTCYTYSAERGTTFYKSFTCDSSDLIYFAIEPCNTYVYVTGTLKAY